MKAVTLFVRSDDLGALWFIRKVHNDHALTSAREVNEVNVNESVPHNRIFHFLRFTAGWRVNRRLPCRDSSRSPPPANPICDYADPFTFTIFNKVIIL